MRIKVDRDACQTAASCLLYRLKDTEPLYELDDESLAVLKKEDGTTGEDWVEASELAGFDPSQPDKMRAILLESAQSCPFNAIILEDDDGTVLWPKEVA